MQYLETSTDMNDDHDFGNTDDPDGVAQGVHDLTASCAAKGMIPSKANSKVAVGHQGICYPHTKLQKKQAQWCQSAACISTVNMQGSRHGMWQNNANMNCEGDAIRQHQEHSLPKSICCHHMTKRSTACTCADNSLVTYVCCCCHYIGDQQCTRL